MEFELHHHSLVLRHLLPEDEDALGIYFDSLSPETRKRFAPHPLTAEYAKELVSSPARNSTQRWVVCERGVSASAIHAYFILEHERTTHEQERFANYGIAVSWAHSATFAPSVSDAWQSRGLASAVMPLLIGLWREQGLQSIVLMGGVQSDNVRAVRFYQKFGFQTVGTFRNDVENEDSILWL